MVLCLGFWTSNSVAQVTVNPGGGSYATLNAAFAAINTGAHTGAITITITGNTTEPAVSIPLLKSGGTSNYTSISIKPSGGNWTINSAAAPTASRGVIELYGADNVTIDGDDPGTAGTRNLSFVVATSASTGIAAIRLASTSTTGTDGADNNTIKNCIIIGSRNGATSTTTNYGINMSNSSLITTGAYSSLNTLIENNLITRCYQGIFANGASATYPNTGTIIRNNVLGSSVAADNIGGRAINIAYSSASVGAGSALIEGNDMRVGDVSPTGAGYSASIGGIEVGTVNSGLKIRRNNIHDILQPSTSGYGAYGINISGSANCDNIEISNNYIVNIVGIRYTTTVASTFVAYGIRYNAGATLQKINYNTIYLPNTTVGTIANYVNYGIYTVSTATIAEFKNNIIVNENVGTGTMGFYAAATGNISAGAVNYNDYYVPSGNVGYYNAVAQNTLTNWQTATSKDLNSISVVPGFTSSTDFHILVSSTSVNALGTPVAGITADFDGDTRNASTPDIGADEYSPLVCLTANGGTVTPANVSKCVGQTYTMSAVGATIGGGITYEWQVSTTSGGPYSNVSGGSGANSVNYTTPALTAGTYYYVLKVTCSNGPVVGYSNELTVVVNANPTVSVSPSSGSFCNPGGAPVNLTAAGASTYSWSPASGLSATSGATVDATPSVTTTYTVTGTDVNGCTGTATASVTSLLSPAGVTAVASPSAICNGGVANLTATGSIPGNFNVGTATGILSTTGSPYRAGAGSPVKTQLLYTAAELSAAGLTAGPITGLGFTASNPTGTLASFDVYIGHSSASALTTTFETSALTQVFSQTSFTPVNGVNMHTFNMGSFSWDGVSNILIQTCLVNGTSGTAACSTYTAAGQDLQATGTNVCTAVLTGSLSTSKPVIRFAQLIPVSFSWSPASDVVSPTNQNTTTIPLSASTTYTVTAANGGCSNSASVTVSVEPLSCSPATYSTPVCDGSNFNITANHTGGGAPYSYSWDDGNGGVYPNTKTIPLNLPAGTYTFVCTVNDNCGSSCTSSVTVTVNGLPTVTVTPNTGLICNPSGTPVTLTAGGASTYAWSPASGLSATTGTTVNANPLISSSYTVIGTDVNGCTGSASAAISVNTKANITASATPSSICEGASSTLSANSGTTGSATVGTATTSIGGSNGNPYRSGNGTGYQIRTQLLYTAAELIAAGVQPGPFSSIGFTTQSASGGTIINLSIELGITTATALTSTFETTPMTTVFTQASFTPLAAGLNVHVFNAGSFSWDGVSNILVNVCQTNSVLGTATVSCFTPATISNNHKSTSTTSCSDLTGTTVTAKPIVTFGWTDNTSLYSWSWEPGTLSGNSVSVSPSATTAYTVTATSAAGCTATATVNVNVSPNVTYYADADNDTYGNAGVTQITCTGAPSGYVADNTDCNDGIAAINPGAVELCNNIDDNCNGSTDEGFDVDGDGYTSCNGDCDDNNNAVHPGATEICNGIDDDCNGLTDDNTVPLLAPASISGPATACLPGVAGTATFSTTAVAGATGYAWTVPAGMTITSGQGTLSINVAYTNTAIQTGISGTLCVYANNACVNGPATCVNIDYQVAAPVTPNSISGPGKVCPGDVATYSIATVARATSYTWSVPTGMTVQSGQGTNVVSVQVTAGFVGGSISVTASNVCGTSAARTKSLTQNLPGTPTAIAGQKEGLCNTVGNVYSIPAVANATSYLWTVTGGTITGGQGTTSITVDVAALVGTGAITVQAVNGCGNSLVRSLTISGAPARPGVISGSASVCSGTTEPYSVATIAGASSYNWSVTANGTVASGQGTKNITVTWGAAAGGQALNVTTSNACGTSLTRSLNGITISTCPRMSDEFSSMQMVIMPNPATAFAKVQFNAGTSGDYRLRITDVTGRVVFMQDANAGIGMNTIALDLSTYATGMYSVQLDFNGEQQVSRMIIE